MSSVRTVPMESAPNAVPPLGVSPSTRPRFRPLGTGATSGATLTPFGPGNDLQGTQIAPGMSQPTRTALGQTQAAANAYSGQTFTPFQSVGPFTSGATGQYGAIAPVTAQQAGTTNPTAAYGYQDAATRALSSGAAASGTQGLIGLGNYGGMAVSDGGPGGSYAFGGFGSDVDRSRALTLQSLEQAMSGPERLQLAQEAYDQMVERSSPQFEMDQRNLSRRTAALGRAGSGMVNSEFADLGTARERELSLARRELSTQAAGQTLADRIARTQLGQGVATDFGNLDLGAESMKLSGAQLDEQGANRRMQASSATANSLNDAARLRLGANQALVDTGMAGAEFLRGLGNDRFSMDSRITGERGADADRRSAADVFNTGLRERQAQFSYDADRDTYASQVGERDAARADTFNVDRALGDRVRTFDDYLRGREGQDRSNRDELRGERDYQTAQERQAIEDDYRSAQFDEWLRNSRAGRMGGYAATGYGYDPTGAYQQAAGYYGNQADASAAATGPMLQYLMSRQRTTPAPAARAG